MKTTTTTQTTHYEIQKKRRESLLDEWKGYHKNVLKRRDVVMHQVPSRRIRSGVYAGYDGDRPTKNLDATVHELAPGLYQSRHRHGGEAWLYVVSGRGHSEVDGIDYPWEAGDLIVVDHWSWHQHFNDDKEKTARLIRVHNFDALYDMMRILLDPLNLFEELPELDAPDLTGIVWPDHFEGRPD